MENLASDIYSQFSKMPGSHSIANRRALELFEIFIRLDKSENPILEIGAGIGTITRLLLSTTKQKIYAQEFNDECIIKLTKIKKKYQARLYINKEIVANSYKFIIIDGPYNKLQMLNAIKLSANSLSWIAIENGRTATRIQIANSLYKAGFRQSVVEFKRPNFKPSLTLFFVETPPYKLRIQSLFDFLVIMCRFWPKYIKLILKYGGKHYKVGKKLENEFGKA